MKVLHISNSIKGGAGIAAFRIHQALRNSGVDSSVLTRWDSRPDEHIYQHQRPLWTKILEHCGLPLGNNKYLRFADAIQAGTRTFPFALYDISQNPLVREADIIHLHWVGNILNYKKFFSCIKKPILWTLHDMNPFMGMAHYEHDNELIQKDHRLSHIDAEIRNVKVNAYKNCSSLSIACLSYEIMKKSIASTSFCNRKHFLIRNCIPSNTFFPKNKIEMRIKMGIPQHKKVFLFISHAVEDTRKGFYLLLEAIRKMPENCIYVCVGRYSSELNTENILQLGPIKQANELSTIYSCADALLLPSVEDNLPNTMLESLSCGVPVISFPIGGMRDIIQSGNNGILAKSLGADSLRKAMMNFLSDGVDWNCKKIAKNAREEFAPHIIAEQYIKIYRNILDQ